MRYSAARDPRIARGMVRQCTARAALLEDGAQRRGWKVGLTTPISRETAGIDRPLVGFLTDAGELVDGGALEIRGWTKPMVEAEIAIRLGTDVRPDADQASARAAISALAVAIEIVDLTLNLDQVEELLAANIFHRAFVLGPPVEALAGGETDGIVVRAWIDGALKATEEDPRAVIGDPVDAVLLVARELDQVRLRLEPGDWILAGSAIPLTPVRPGEQLRVEATGLGELRLGFA